jgi:diamine N-acetyltransferase
MKLAYELLTPQEAEQVGPRLGLIDPWQRLGLSGQALTDYLKRPDPSLHAYGVWGDYGLTGVLAVRSPWLRGPYLELLAIFPEAQRQGLGAQALGWLINHYQNTGAVNFWACVSTFNHNARSFYARMGFVEVTALSNLVRSGDDEILLRRLL